MITETFPLIVAGEEITGERQLAKDVENGLLLNGSDSIRYIVVHCSATRCNRDYTAEQMLKDHKARGFRTIGYHFYIRKSGMVTQHRRLLEAGAHCRPYNRCSIGICYEGGLGTNGKPADTRTEEQREQLLLILMKLKKLFPKAKIAGHRDMPGATPKDCPCFDAEKEYRNL